MENALSNPRDGLSARGAARSAVTTSEAPASSAASSPAQQTSAPQIAAKLATSATPQMVSVGPTGPSAESASETNNNLKIFKSEYDTKPSAMARHSNGVTDRHQEQQQQQQQQDNKCQTDERAAADTELAVSGPSASETNLTDPPESQKQQPTSTPDALASAQVPATDMTESSQSQSDSEQQQQQQVPSPTVNKLPANNRSILILRDIQSETPEESVRGIFDSENCPSRPVHCEYALHNSWYVTFSDDDDAKLALAYIRKHIVRWQGKPIMARYKPKPAVASAANEPAAIHHHAHTNHHHHHHHPHAHPNHHHHQHQHPHHRHEHQNVPNMVMQQQSHYQGEVVDGAGSMSSPGFALGEALISPATATSVDGDTSAGHHSHHNHSDHHFQQHAPMVMSPAGMLASHTGGPVSHNGGSSGLMPPTSYGPHTQQHPPPAQPPPQPHHHQPDGSMLHHPHHHLAQMMGPLQQQAHHHHHHHPMAAGYGAPYYNQHGQLIQHAAPWDLSSVFIYNGLSPYNKTSVSSVALVGGAYHQPQGQHNQHPAHLSGPHSQQQHQHQHYSSHQRHQQRQHHGQGQSHHAHQNHQGATNNGGSHQHTFGSNNHHQGTKSSRKNHNNNNNSNHNNNNNSNHNSNKQSNK